MASPCGYPVRQPVTEHPFDLHQRLSRPERVRGDKAVAVADGRAVVTVGVGPEQAESPALINALAPRDEVPDPGTFDLANANAARPPLLDAGFASVATADIAFDVAAQMPAGPVAAAVRHCGSEPVEAALRSFFAPRSRADGTVRMSLVFRCYLAKRGR
jgi:hypothetical protein